MMENEFNKDIAKEFLILVSYCDSIFFDNIPENVLKKLRDLAADSTKEFYIDKSKTLLEQNISEECKDLIGIMYFLYVADDSLKTEMLKSWLKNDSEILNN